MPFGIEVGLSPWDFVLDGDPAPSPKRGADPPTFWPMFIIVIVISLEHCTVVIGLFKFYYSMHSVFRNKVFSLIQCKYFKQIFIVQTASMGVDRS